MGYHRAVRALRIVAAVLYATYLVHVGLLLLLAPWSAIWNAFTAAVPLPWSLWLASPAVRGALSALGALHLLLLAAEFLGLGRPTRRPADGSPARTP